MAQQTFELPTNDANAAPACPKCGAPTTLRNGRRGPFYGCTRFPTCRGLVNAEPDASTAPASPMAGSPEQEAIWHELQTGAGHVVVKALAGTGKSFTCRHGMRRLPAATRILYLAFNKEIVREFEKDAPLNAEIRTLNAIGFRICRQAFPNAVLHNDKIADLIQELLPPDLDKPTFRVIATAADRLVALCQGYLNDGTAPDLLSELAARHEVEIDPQHQETVFELVPRLLQMDLDRTSVLSFNDQIWFPVQHQLPTPKYDVIFVDEAQDLNPCQHQLVLRLLAPQGRVVVVGDDHQAIYGFRGSDVDSIANFTDLLRSSSPLPIATLPLTVTRRCPQSVVAEAQQFVPEFSALPDAQPGTVSSVDDHMAFELYRPGDMILCRCNAPLVSVAFSLIRQGKKAVIRGRDIGQGLLALIERLHPHDVNDLLKRLDDYQTKELAKLAGTRREETLAQQLVDRVDCIRYIAEAVDTLSDLTARISSLFENFDQDGQPRGAVVLSSIHRAKGLEADRVFWLYPEICVKSLQEWQQRQELNLRYVAITRSKDTLVYVYEAKRHQPEPAPLLFDRCRVISEVENRTADFLDTLQDQVATFTLPDGSQFEVSFRHLPTRD